MSAISKIIWLTDKRLYVKDGTTNIELRVNILDKTTKPSLVTKVGVLPTIDIKFWEEELSVFKILGLLVMWSNALVSITHVLFIDGLPFYT